MPEQVNGAATPATPTPSLTGQISGTSNGASAEIPKWAMQLPPEMRLPEVVRHKNFADFAKEAIELGKSGLRVPGADATDEELAEFYSKIGRPESPDKYEIKFAEGTPVDDNLLGAFRGIAHKIGLTGQQAQQLGEWWAAQAQGVEASTGAEATKSLEEWDKQLTTDWGWQKDRNINLAARAYNMAIDGMDDATKTQLNELMDSTGLGNHPLLIKMFYQMALKSGEDKLITASSGPSADDRQTAQEQIRAIRGDKSHAYNDAKNPAHRDAVRHMQALYDIAYAKEGE